VPLYQTDSPWSIPVGTARVLGSARQRVELAGDGVTTNRVLKGDYFRFLGDPRQTWFIVGSVVNETQFDLTAEYSGLQAVDTLLPYAVGRDFTWLLQLREMAPGDIDFRGIYTATMRQIDALYSRDLMAEFTFVGQQAIGDQPFRWYPPYAATIRAVNLSIGTPAMGAEFIVNVKKNGASVFSTASLYPRIIAGQYVGISAQPSSPVMAATDYLTVEIVQVGSTVPGSDLLVQVRF
jgi:hypothetical protein